MTLLPKTTTYYSLEHACDFCEACDSIVELDDVTGDLVCMACIDKWWAAQPSPIDQLIAMAAEVQS